MTNRLISILAVLIFLTGSLVGDTGRIEVIRDPDLSISGTGHRGLPERKVHPAQSLFPKRGLPQEKTRQTNFDRLLVLLVDFQEDDNPQTTGNGKFVLEYDPEYPVTVGAPPRDYDYFSYHLEAMRYYYLAASLGNYNLEYDIYPRKDSDYFAYTLPNEMAYYNPGFADPNLFVERVEEYFYQILQIADESGDIDDFGQYGHFMFIHAGSDWQHDVYGDTPHDLPSFFVSVAEGKEYIASDGTIITSAANVPETISQDDRYGVINAVMAHEFGHSLGFVDLYNVRNSYPGVGYWDIMDSGGSTRVMLEGTTEGEFYAIEGTIPSLPSAWHRVLVFGDHYKAKGYYKNITDFRQEETIHLKAASSKPRHDTNAAYIVKVPINNKEYMLLENRNVDPDGDGGIAIRGAYPLTPGGTDYRVILHPIAIDDDDLLLPTYEYDWLLPGWVNRRGASFGGGIIAWHIDEHLIFNQGVTLSDGSFRSNYENNTVNTDYYDRGISIIEADNIQDVGNPYSWFWYGTEYEPFFRYRPQLDDEGYFIGWSPQEFSHTLSSVSKPPLRSKKGNPSLYSIYSISAVSEIMSFRYRFEPFSSTTTVSRNIQPIAIGSPAESILPDFNSILPAFTEEGVHLFKKYANQEQWEEFYYDLDFTPTQEIATAEGQNGLPRFYIPADDKLHILEDEGFSVNFYQIELNSRITETPIIIEARTIIVPTEQELVIIDDTANQIIKTYPLPAAKISYTGETLYALSNNKLYAIESFPDGNNDRLRTTKHLRNRRDNINVGRTGGSTESPFSGLSRELTHVALIENMSETYTPVGFRDINNTDNNSLFIQDDTGDLYRWSGNSLNKLFSLSPYTKEKPTQLALYEIEDFSGQSTELSVLFGAGNYLFSVDLEGTLEKGYPIYLEGLTFEQGSYPRIIKNDLEELLFILKTDDDGYIVYNSSAASISTNLSMIWDRTSANDLFSWDQKTGSLSFFFTDKQQNLYESFYFETTDNNPIIWNGKRNNRWSSFQGRHNPARDKVIKTNAYAYPNPVSSDVVRIRVNGVRENITLKLFDISGKLVFDNVYSDILAEEYDIRINVSRLSSGLYFGTVQTGGNTASFNLALEK